MSKETLITETSEAITQAIVRSRDNMLEAVLSIIKSYKELQLPENPKDAYDLGARDTVDTLLIHLNKFAEGLKKARK